MMLFLAGCVSLPNRTDGPAEVRSIYVREPAGAADDGMRRCGEVAHDAAVRRLESMGYRAAAEETEADAVLDGRWEITVGGPLSGRRFVGLNFELRSRAGKVLFTADVIPRTPVNFLSPDRVREELSVRLAELGRAPYVR